jgi:hypothetical protein
VTDRTGPRWRKSSYSDTGACVEVATVTDDVIAVRNSNQPQDRTLRFASNTLRTWIEGVKTGEFDDLA